MGRKSHSRSLSIWANGIRVGTWTIPTRGDMQLQYDQAWVDSDLGRPLSLSLPFTLANQPLKGEKVLHYFDNLLPDSDAIRKRVAARFKTGSIEAFDLLQAIGRDCVGSVQLLAEDEAPTRVGKVEATPLTEEDIERLLIETVSPASMAAGGDPEDDFRISLAGAQEKTALLWWKGKWRKPHGSTPTTHILKLPMGLVGGRQADFTTSVDNEWLCMKLLKAYGLDVAEVDIATFGTQRVLVVERFDRRVAPDGRWILRLPQEDFCQALGCSPLLKYEKDGGPGLKDLFGVLKHSDHAEADMRTLMTAQVLFWLLRAPDGHAKNFSLQILPRGRFRLAKLYDVMSAYPVLGEGPNQWSPRRVGLAMALLGKSRHYAMHGVMRRHFNSTAQKVGYGETAEAVIQDVLEKTPMVIEQLRRAIPGNFSAQVSEGILAGLGRASEELSKMPSA